MSGFAAAISGALHDSNAPLPANNDGAHPTKAFLQKSIQDIAEIMTRDNTLIDASAIPAVLDMIKNKNSGGGLDDRKLLLEKMLVVMSHLPTGNDLSQKLQNAAIELFYKDLPHPPSYIVPPKPHLYEKTIREDDGSFKDNFRNYPYRTADGSNNNPLQPMLGMANQPYGRTVPSIHLQTPSVELPDAGLVFDTLLRRPKDTFTQHPAGISALFFAFADLVIHSIFSTNHADVTINKTSSYLDLSPLYGNNEKEMDRIRRKDGTGRLWDDTFNDSRLLFMPPAVCALLVLLSRNHNYIASKLLAINERKLYQDPSTLDEKQKLKQDERLFHQTRLINTGYFMQIILGDYVGVILGLSRDRIAWRLDPLVHMRSSKDHSVSPPRAEGSLVSVEFNLMYRWHSTISQADSEWTQKMFEKLFKTKDLDQITIADFKRVAHEVMIPPEDPREWTFNGLQRDSGGRFRDAELARIIHDSTGSYAAAFQARGSPASMRIIEILGIEEARAWGTCSMNEFRKFMGLKPYASFSEWNPDTTISTAAAALYKDIDNLELYVGLQAEEPKKPGPGAGLCPGYTISRAILSDAVCLTRGDRFLTTEFTPFNLTNWGYQDCILSNADRGDGSYGGILTKLLFRTLPDYYPAGSVYAHFPFLVPEFLKKDWLDNGHVDLVAKYAWDRPRTPIHPVITVNEEKKEWKSAYDMRMYRLSKGAPLDTTATKKVLEAKQKQWEQRFLEETKGLIARKSFTRVGKRGKFVDVVRDVINLLPVHWISESVAGLPLKSEDNLKGLWEEHDVYQDIAAVAEYLLLNFEPAHDWILRERSAAFYDKFANNVCTHLDGGILTSIVNTIGQTKDQESKKFLGQVKEAKQKEPSSSLAASVFSQVVPSAAQYSHVLSLVVDHYAENEDKKREIVRLAGLNTKEGNDGVVRLVREALVANPPVISVMRTCMADALVGDAKVHAGQRVFVNLPTGADVLSNDTGSVFPGLSTDGLLSPVLFAQTAPKVLAYIFALKGLRKVSKMEKFTQDWRDGKDVRYLDTKGRTSPFPTTLVVQYDA